MTSRRSQKKTDRLFVRDGRHTYRRRYSIAEVRYGAGILLVLLLVFSWVAWKGAHPDPELFAAGIGLLNPGNPQVDRGPLPDGIAPAGWTEGAISQYDTTNLYVKIDGREDFYRAFGFERLYFVSITNEVDPAVAVDIELFDLATGANALGAYAGERPPEIIPELSESGMAHIARNALFLTRGRYYIRAIGSDEVPEVLELLAWLRPLLESGIEGEPLPWGYALFSGALGLDPGGIDYMTENAFSFGFARDVYAATLEDGETQLFVVAVEDETSAERHAREFTYGFLSYGEIAKESDGVVWIRDRYQKKLSACSWSGPWVIGVRGAVEIEAAGRALVRLRDAVGGLSGETHSLALAGRKAAARSAGHDEGEAGGSGEDGGSGEPGEDESYGEGESYAGGAEEGGDQ